MSALATFVKAMTELVERTQDEPVLLAEGRRHLSRLIDDDHWLPASHRQARSDRYAQYLLHRDPAGRFSVVSFVWGPGQRTPVHNHTVWGLVGVLQGAESCDEYHWNGQSPVPAGHQHTLQRGQIEAVSPRLGDWHRVSNALADRPSISIHVYGADIGLVKRQRLDDQGRLLEFVSGYDTPAH